MTQQDRWKLAPLPEDPRERRRISIRLVALAMLGLIAILISALAR